MSAPSSASSSPAITLRKVDPTRRMSSVKSGPAVATFTSFSLHVNDLDASLTFFQSLFQWSVIRHEEHDIKDAAGEGVNNGAHSITYVGPSSKDFTIALVYNYGVSLTQETPLHHIAVSCNIEKTLSLAKQHGYDIKQQDGDTCVISGDGHRYKLVNVEGEIEKPNVVYVSIFTKSLIRSSDFYTTVLSMSTSTDTPCTTQFAADVKHSMYGYASNQVQLQLVQFPDVCDKRERLIITCKDVSSMSTRIKSARATLLHQDGVYDMTRDKDGYVVVVANEKEWGKKMEAGANKIDAEERSRRLEMTHVWMKSNPTPAPDPMAHIARTTPPPATRITSPGSIERKSSLSNPSSRSSSPMNVVSPTPSPTSVSVLSNSSSSSIASSTNSSILKLPNAKPAHTRLITTEPHPNIQEYEHTIELLQEQLIQKSNELNMAYEKIKNKMEQVKEILQLKEDENQRLRQQLKDAGIAPCVPHQSIGQLIATPVQAVRRLSASRTSTSTPPPSQGRSLTSTPPPPPPSQGRNSTSSPPPPPSQGRNSTSSPVPSQNQEPVQPRVVSPVA